MLGSLSAYHPTSRQREHHQRRAAWCSVHLRSIPLHPATPPHRHADVLLAVHAVGHRVPMVARAGVERPEQRTRARIEGVEAPVRLTGKYEISPCRQQRGYHWVRRAPRPHFPPRRWVERLHVPPLLLIVQLYLAAPVRHSFLELLREELERAAQLDHRGIEEAGLRVVRRMRPLLRPGRAGADVNALRGRRDARRHTTGRRIDVAPGHARILRHPHETAIGAIEDEEMPVL